MLIGNGMYQCRKEIELKHLVMRLLQKGKITYVASASYVIVVLLMTEVAFCYARVFIPTAKAQCCYHQQY
jgi:hypothetical protein